MPDPIGRPSKLTPETHAAAVALAAKGYPQRFIADSLEIHRDTLHGWLLRADGRVEGADDSDGLYAAFARAWRAARARWVFGQLDLLDIVKKDDGVIARAVMWKLEKLFPDEFSTKQAVELTGKNGTPIEHEHKVAIVDPRALSQRIAALDAAGAAGGPPRGGAGADEPGGPPGGPGGGGPGGG